MKRIICILALAALCSFAFAQKGNMPVVTEAAQVENESGDTIVEVLAVTKDGETQFWLNVGPLAFGDAILGVYLDPATKLYVPLGSTYDEAMKILQTLKDRYKEPKGSVLELSCNLSVLLPTEEVETVQVITVRPVLRTQLEFVIEKDGHRRSTFLSKDDISSLIFTMKLNGKRLSKL